MVSGNMSSLAYASRGFRLVQKIHNNVEKRRFFAALSSAPQDDRYRTHVDQPYYLKNVYNIKMETEMLCMHPRSLKYACFALKKEFIDEWANKKPRFGFNGLGELVYRRTYAKYVGEDSNLKEEWYQTVERVVNGTFSMQKEWILSKGREWDETRAHNEAEEMYRRIFMMKFLPPGRGLWAMGSKLTKERRLFAALNNCAFVSTSDIDSDPSSPFCFLMDASMLGVGVGFDTKGADKITIKTPGISNDENIADIHYVSDSREGWVESLRIVLDAYFLGKKLPQFNYSLIREAGTPIKGFGGVCQGYETLKNLHEELKGIFESKVDQYLDVRTIVDIMNLIGKCVVAGNVRRSAEIAFGDSLDEDFIQLKDYERNPDRASYGWLSNNTVFCSLGMDYSHICKSIVKNGEPGLAWLENMQKYGRMGTPPDYKDIRAKGGNPCLEQTLESYEMCCLVETFPFRHESLEDFLITLRYAFAYAKTVTLGATQWDRTNQIMARNRRIGCSMSGLAQFISAHGLENLRKWCEAGYKSIQKADKDISSFLEIPRSIKTTSIKPSGTVSLLAGATPGLHFPESRFYIRRVRIPSSSELVEPLRRANFKIEQCSSNTNSVVVEIPVDAGEGIRTLDDVSIWEQMNIAAFLQRYWADNQVSCTVSFDPKTEGKVLCRTLDFFQYQLKGISFLPRIDNGAYPQMPYESISEETYKELANALLPLNFKNSEGGVSESRKDNIEVPNSFCDSERCEKEL